MHVTFVLPLGLAFCGTLYTTLFYAEAGSRVAQATDPARAILLSPRDFFLLSLARALPQSDHRPGSASPEAFQVAVRHLNHTFQFLRSLDAKHTSIIHTETRHSDWWLKCSQLSNEVQAVTKERAVPNGPEKRKGWRLFFWRESVWQIYIGKRLIPWIKRRNLYLPKTEGPKSS